MGGSHSSISCTLRLIPGWPRKGSRTKEVRKNRMSLYKIAELMGNSPEICLRHYAALMPEMMHDRAPFYMPISTP